MVEKELAREDLTRHDLGREKFLERTWEWMNRYRPKIRYQLRRLGASCDWTRERFTMDPGPARAVRTVFKHLYDKGPHLQGRAHHQLVPPLRHHPLRSRSREWKKSRASSGRSATP